MFSPLRMCMEPRMSYCYRIMKDILAHPTDTYVVRSERLQISRTWVEKVIKYMEECRHVHRTQARTVAPDTLHLTIKGKQALENLEQLSTLIGG